MTKTAIHGEDLLLLLSYGIDAITMPSLRKWNQSYEGWLYQNGLLGRLHHLQSKKFLLRERRDADWVYHLTASGQAFAKGENDLPVAWRRTWDGAWRQLIFDLPVSRHATRVALLRWLRRQRFGYLQDSVWISPDPVNEIVSAVKDYRDQADAFTILECRCVHGFSNASLVRGAWPFDRITAAYRVYLDFATTAVTRLKRATIHPHELFQLLRQERQYWRHALLMDPRLPRRLWPSEYNGEVAWQLRQKLLSHAARRATG